MSAGQALQIENLSKDFDAPVLRGLDLEVDPGTFTAVLGPSGCGKTTLLRLIAGFERADAGRIAVGGRVVSDPRTHLAAERRGVGFVPQEGALFPHLDVRSNIAFGLARKERGGPRVPELIDLLDLGGLEQRLPHELSGGQQQRVALARALAPTPELILLDEPFSSLDASLRDRLRQEVRDILARAGVTTLFVTHDQAEALSIAETVAVMRDGIVEQAGTPEEIYSRPSSRWVADFLGEVEIVPGEAAGGHVRCELGSFSAEPGVDGPVDVLVRPESVAIGISGPESAASAEVIGRRFFGHDQLVELRLGSGRTIRSRRLGFPAWHPGDRVRAWVDGPADVLPRDDS